MLKLEKSQMKFPTPSEAWQQLKDLALVQGEREIFWRVNGQDLSPERMAGKILDNLTRYHEAYELSAVAGI